MLKTTLYIGAMATVTATALWSARRAERPRARLWAALAVGAAAPVLAIGLGDDPFGSMRLLAYGLFGFMPLVCAACALLHARSHRRIAALWLAGFLSLEAIAVDAFLIEPHWLEVSRVRIVSSKLSQPVRIALLADLQTDEVGSYERSVIERIVAEKPDLILLAGDYLQVYNDRKRRALQVELRKVLNEAGFAAPLGVYAVQGNVDNADWPDCFTDTEVTAVAETRSFEVGELAVTCLSMADSFASGLTVPATERFHIVLGHCPNFALGDVPGDLLLAGHCHGGQVRLPGLGPIITLARVPRSWAAGVTALPGDRTLIVSRGAGMERGSAPRLRFLCRPELVFIEAVPR